jgi:AAA15 family ATPase/GTPase
MFINKLQLKNFKRFTDLTIDLASQQNETSPKLVLLIGANGSGKSCIFDAFEYLNSGNNNNLLAKNKNNLLDKTERYLIKDYRSREITEISLNTSNRQEYSSIIFNLKDKLIFIDQTLTPKEKAVLVLLNGLAQVKPFSTKEVAEILDITDARVKQLYARAKKKIEETIEPNYSTKKSFKAYGRSAFRYTPRINKTTIGSNNNFERDLNRPQTYIDLDTKRFDDDIDEIFNNFLKEIKEKNNAQENFNNALNTAFINIFGDTNTSLKYEDFDSPVDGQSVQFWFKKGSLKVPYDYLSAGEKMVFELLLNLYARKHLYQDSIVFFDEIDLHLNTSLQFDLLKEITENWIPANSQVWVASHSLGFIDYARQYEKGVIIDFDSLDFDEEQVLKPADKDDLSIFTVPIPISSIENIVQLPSIILCEGKDSKYYSGQNNKQFFGVKDKFNVLEWCWRFKCLGIIDKDYLFKTESIKLENKFKGKLKVLKYYSIENYLLHPENLREYDLNFDLDLYKQEIIKTKNEYLQNKISDYFSQIRSNYKILKSRKDKGLEHDWLIEMEDSSEVLNLLKSDNFEIFYEFFPIKDENKKIKSIQKILKNKSKESLYLELSQTNWFKTKISEVLQ